MGVKKKTLALAYCLQYRLAFRPVVKQAKAGKGRESRDLWGIGPGVRSLLADYQGGDDK